jgi:hypothetical protein
MSNCISTSLNQKESVFKHMYTSLCAPQSIKCSTFHTNIICIKYLRHILPTFNTLVNIIYTFNTFYVFLLHYFIIFVNIYIF